MTYWDRLSTPLEFNTQGIEFTKAGILEFASEFDPQPYHLDDTAGDDSIFGGLCASGWQVGAVALRQLSDSLAQAEIAFLGLQDTSDLTWKSPVFSGDQLHCNIVLSDPQPSTQRPECGTVNCVITLKNQHHKTVMHMISTIFIAKEPKEAPL